MDGHSGHDHDSGSGSDPTTAQPRMDPSGEHNHGSDMHDSGSHPGIDSHSGGYCIPRSGSGSVPGHASGSEETGDASGSEETGDASGSDETGDASGPHKKRPKKRTKITVIKQTLNFSGVTKKALDTPEKKASLEKSIAKALGVSGNDRITIVIIDILDMTTGEGTRRRLNTAGAEIIYEVHIEEAEDSEDTAPPESGSRATSIPVITVSSIKSKMKALAAATSPDSSNSALGTDGATALSEIESAVAAQADVDVASIKTEASEVSVRVVKTEDAVGDDSSNSDQSDQKVSGDSGAKDQGGEIGSIIGAVAGSLALFGVAGIAFWIYRNEARKKRDAATAKRSGHGYQNSFNPLKQAGIELAVAMPSHDGTFIDGRAPMTNNPNNPKSAESMGFAALPPPPPPTGPGLKRKVQVALYDYEANGAGQISISAGDTLIPTEHVESNADWTSGTNVRTEEVGFYPSQYVKDQL
jgi:hypothetical protein